MSIGAKPTQQKSVFSSVFITVIKILYFPIKIVDAYLIHKRKDIWVFGSNYGNFYNYNSRYFFEYLSAHNSTKRRELVWLTNSDVVFDHLKMKGLRCYKFFSIRGIYYSIFSKVRVISDRYNDLPLFSYFFNQNTMIVQLWHGIPIKRIDVIKLRWLDNFGRIILTTILGRRYDFFLTTTSNSTKFFTDAFQIDENIVKPLGYPRVDASISNQSASSILYRKKYGNAKVILCLPTYRDRGNTFDLFFSDSKPLSELNRYFNEKNYIMLVKLHNIDLMRFKNISLKQFSNIKFLESDPTFDIYFAAAGADILLTDYSSICLEFSLLKKPVIFLRFDKDNYLTRERELYSVYAPLNKDAHISSWGDLINILNKNHFPNDNISKFCEMYIGLHDGGASRRIELEIENNL